MLQLFKPYCIACRKCFVIILLAFFLSNCSHFDVESSEKVTIEILQIDSIYQVKLYKIRDKVGVVEYSTFEQVIKAGLLDSSALNDYFKIRPMVGFDLFIYNCASCHYANPTFVDSLKSLPPKTGEDLKNILCSIKHSAVDSLSSKRLNDFEISLINIYINK